MTQDALKKYIAGIAKSLKLDVAEDDAFLDAAIMAGAGTFWSCRKWLFRRVLVDLPITSTADGYAVPEDFEAYVSVVDRTEDNRKQLRYYLKEEFDYKFPDPSYHAAGAPKVFTVYKDKNTGLQTIQFFPQPTARTLKLYYATKYPGKPDLIPDGYSSALTAMIERQLYPAATEQRIAATRALMQELQELTIREGLADATDFKIFDDDDYEVTPERAFGDIG